LPPLDPDAFEGLVESVGMYGHRRTGVVRFEVQDIFLAPIDRFDNAIRPPAPAPFPRQANQIADLVANQRLNATTEYREQYPLTDFARRYRLTPCVGNLDDGTVFKQVFASSRHSLAMGAYSVAP
jgi:hypothetical protein